MISYEVANDYIRYGEIEEVREIVDGNIYYRRYTIYYNDARYYLIKINGNFVYIEKLD